MRNKIIKVILNNKDNFISGEDLSNKLGISRTAVWKHIKKLKEEGYNIESVNKKGYRLESFPGDLLTSENIYDFQRITIENRTPTIFRSVNWCLSR